MFSLESYQGKDVGTVVRMLLGEGWRPMPSPAFYGPGEIVPRSARMYSNPFENIAARVSFRDTSAALHFKNSKENPENPWFPRVYEQVPLFEGGHMVAMERLLEFERKKGPEYTERQYPLDERFHKMVLILTGKGDLYGLLQSSPTGFAVNLNEILRAYPALSGEFDSYIEMLRITQESLDSAYAQGHTEFKPQIQFKPGCFLARRLPKGGHQPVFIEPMPFFHSDLVALGTVGIDDPPFPLEIRRRQRIFNDAYGEFGLPLETENDFPQWAEKK